MAARPTGDDLPEGERLGTETAAELGALFTEHAPAGYSYLRSCGVDRETAEDLVADVFLKISRRLRSGGTVKSPRSYVIHAVRNAWISWLETRNRKRWPDAAARLEVADWSSVDEIDRICDHDDRLASALRGAMATLPSRQREIIEMHYFARMSVAAIAVRLVIAEGTVRYHLSKGRDKLNELLDGWSEDGSDT